MQLAWGPLRTKGDDTQMQDQAGWLTSRCPQLWPPATSSRQLPPLAAASSLDLDPAPSS